MGTLSADGYQIVTQKYRARPKRRRGMKFTGQAILASSRTRLHGQQAFPLHFLASQLAGAAYGLGLFARTALGRLFIMATQLHFAENTFPLHLFLQGLERLINIVVPNENLHAVILFGLFAPCGVTIK